MPPFRQKLAKAHEKHPHSLGAVSFYKPEYCDQVIQCMAEGYSLTAFAGSIGVSKASVYRWITEYPEFSVAVEQARAARLKAWETKLMNADKGAQAAIAAKLIDDGEQVEAKICLGFYLCEDCGQIHFIEAPAELQ